MATAAAVFALGCAIAAAAPAMPVLLGGRLVSGFGGGALVALTFVSVERLFSRDIWPQLFAILSSVGHRGLHRPADRRDARRPRHLARRLRLLRRRRRGARLASMIVLPRQADAPSTEQAKSGLPVAALLCLAVSISLIAAAGVDIEARLSALMMAAGVAGLAAFFWLPARDPATRPSQPASSIHAPASARASPRSRRSPSPPSRPPSTARCCSRASTASGPSSSAILSLASCSPRRVLSILVANAPPERERLIITRRRCDDRRRHRLLRLRRAVGLHAAHPRRRAPARRRLRHRLALHHPQNG